MKGKQFKIRNSYGIRNIYTWIKQNKFFNLTPITEKEFSTLIKEIHQLLINNFIQGHAIVFPYNMGKLELLKHSTSVKLEDNKIKVKKPINWYATKKLWENDAEAKKNKTLIRTDVDYVYKVSYNKSKSKYKNKTFVRFTVNRFFRNLVTSKTRNKELDTCYEIY